MTVSSSAHTIYLWTLGLFSVFLLLEALAPRRRGDVSPLWRWGNNFSLGLINWYILLVASTLFFMWLARWGRASDFSVIELGHLSGFVVLLAGTQFVSYWLHRAFHRFPLLWRIHAVHHSDPEVDVSTGYRHHPLEPLISLPVGAPLVLLLGVSAESVLAYRLFAVAATVFSHSNVLVPERAERWLRYLLLTPDFHRTHHFSEQRYTNSNYGSLVPWYDYLFGTARHVDFDDHDARQLGLEYLREPVDQRLDRLLLTPLLPQRTSGDAAGRAPLTL
jgi:sterol desaturase/sphingolipid hydroxylase (fatty acid hydroxylase superfamily)